MLASSDEKVSDTELGFITLKKEPLEVPSQLVCQQVAIWLYLYELAPTHWPNTKKTTNSEAHWSASVTLSHTKFLLFEKFASLTLNLHFETLFGEQIDVKGTWIFSTILKTNANIIRQRLVLKYSN